MKTYFKAYRQYLRNAAIGLPFALVSPELWGDVLEAVKEIFFYLVELFVTVVAFCIIVLLTAIYPLSVPLIALAECERDRRRSKRLAEACNADYVFNLLDVATGKDETSKFLFEVTNERDPDGSPRLRMVCTKAPVGYLCTRDLGHEGPCAAESV